MASIDHRRWRTAKVASYGRAALCVGRLRSAGITHQVVREGREVRIQVQLNDLDAAVNLLADLAISPDSRQSKEPILHRHALPLLIGIPLGSAIGGFIATRLAVSTVPWSIGGAVCLSILVTAIYAQCKPTQSDQV